MVRWPSEVLEIAEVVEGAVGGDIRVVVKFRSWKGRLRREEEDIEIDLGGRRGTEIEETIEAVFSWESEAVRVRSSSRKEQGNWKKKKTTWKWLGRSARRGEDDDAIEEE